MKLVGLKDVGGTVQTIMFFGIAIIQEVIFVLPMVHASKRARLHMHMSLKMSVKPIIMRTDEIGHHHLIQRDHQGVL